MNLKKCRLCQENIGIYYLSSNDILCKKILLCSRVNVHDLKMGYRFPESICENCFFMVNEIYAFQNKCLDIDKKLRHVLISSGDVAYNNYNELENIGMTSNQNEYQNDMPFKCMKCCSYCIQTNSTNKFDNSAQICPKCDLLFEPISEVPIKIKSEKDDTFAQNDNSEYIPLKNDVIIKEEPIENCDLNRFYDYKHSENDVTLKKESTNYNYPDKNDNFKENKTFDHKFEASTKQKFFVCPFSGCKRIFKISQHFQAHKNKHVNQKPHMCSYCGKSFNKKFILMAHETIHTNKKSCCCKICGKQFKARSSLRMHAKVHQEKKKFRCTFCEKKFNSNDSLQRHSITHSGVKQFKCDKCPAEFYTLYERRRHVAWIHEGIKIHNCTICLKKFASRYRLIIHMRIHTNERPFACGTPGCDKSYMDRKNLRRHCNQFKHQIP